MAVTYDNIFYDYCLDPLRDLFVTEYNYGKIYIAPQLIYRDPFSIRIWGGSTDTEEYLATAWQKQYNIEISLYEIEKNPEEAYFKQFYNDIERIYQLLFTNAKSVSTTIGSNTYQWIDGICESVELNELNEEEEAVEGLNVAKFNFNCKIIREG